MTKLQPLGNRVIVERDESEATTRGGIVLPETAREQAARGRIIRVGPGQLSDTGTRTPLQVKRGDRVIFSQYAGSEVEIGQRKLLVMREGDILAVVE
ncbi:co-chaperone GroES [Roseiconus nitratireducens]|nr:co-chaperone GroES [Roseiconus nitratireducens]